MAFETKVWGVMGALALVACGGGGGTPDGGGGADAGPTDGAIGDGGVVCPTVTTVIGNVQASALQLAGAELLFLDEGAGPMFYQGSTKHTRALRKVRTDGTGDTVLHEAAAGFQVTDFVVAGATIYFLEAERLMNGVEQSRVYSMPVAGGMPTLIGLHDDARLAPVGDYADAIVASDATSVYLVRNILSPATMWRMAIAGGAEAIVHNGYINSRPILIGSDLYFQSSQFPGMTNYKGIAKIPASATNGTLTQVGMAYCSGEFNAGPWGFACAGAQQTMDQRKVSKFDPSGGNHVELFQPFPSGGGTTARIGPSDGTYLWVTGNQSTSSFKPIFRAPLAGGAATVAACDRGKIRRRGDYNDGSSNDAFSVGLDMAVGASEIFWAETRKETSGDQTSIFKVAR